MNTVPFLDLLHQYMPHGSSQDLRLILLPKHVAFPGSFSVSPQRTASSPLGSSTSGSCAPGAQSSSKGGPKRPLEEVGAPQESPRLKRPGTCREWAVNHWVWGWQTLSPRHPVWRSQAGFTPLSNPQAGLTSFLSVSLFLQFSEWTM